MTSGLELLYWKFDDRVLLRNVGIKGTHKIAVRWSEEVFVVVAQPSMDTPVYEVKPEMGNGRSRTLHRNLLLPILNLPLDIEEPPKQSQDYTG